MTYKKAEKLAKEKKLGIARMNEISPKGKHIRRTYLVDLNDKKMYPFNSRKYIMSVRYFLSLGAIDYRK